MKEGAVYRKVLVVEDDDDVLELIAALLRDGGLTVYTARDGGGALARLREVRVDLILLDFTLPDMTGSEFLTIHRRVSSSTAPVVILSGSEDGCAFGEQRSLPVLRKPFGAAELLTFLAGDRPQVRR